MPSNNTKALGEAVVPHPPLTHYYADEAARASWVRDVFDRTAGDYDRIEHLMAFGTGRWYRHEALLRAGLAPNMDVLDVGTGTGLTAVEAIAIVGDPARVIGVDPSPGMLAASKVPPASPKLVGGAENLPVDAASADFVTMGYALRHVADLPTVFAEFQRVLRPGGRLCVLEITRPRSRLGVLGLKIYMRGIVPVLARLFGRSREMPALMRYYWDTIEACVPPETVLKQLREAGFSQVHRHMVGPIFSEYQAVKPTQTSPH